MADRDLTEQAQKSEVHEATEDATSSPTNPGADDAGAPAVSPNPGGNPRSDKKNKDPAGAYPRGVHVKRDDSDNGGPLEIETDDI